MKQRITRSAALGALLLATVAYAQPNAGTPPPTTASANPLTSRARDLFRQGRVKEAVAVLEPSKDAVGINGREVRLLLGEYLIASGRRKEAEGPLLKIVEEYNDDTIKAQDAQGLAMVGRAAHLLRSPKDANKAFNESERADKKNVDMLLWRADLFLEKYDPGHAEEVTREALAVAPKNPNALVMMARVKLEQTLDFEAAEKLAKEALAADPKHTGAYAVRATIALHDGDLGAADSLIAAGLAINPNELELWSLRAASRFLGDDLAGYAAAKKETLARNPEYARFFETVGHLAEWEHRYDDVVAMMKEAVAIDPADGKSWGQLGLTQMRGGDEAGGMLSLQKAWSRDHYNVRVYNTLNLYEKTIPSAYESQQSGVFSVRYPKDEKAVLERYIPRMLGEAWGSMKARYGYVPQTPVAIELYSNREQFSVRTSGLPNIGIQGVCFGRVVAAMSPRSEAFNWGNVVWHELGHVFAIQMSKNHVPRWFTEGLSEYETIARRTEWQRELDPELYLAIKRGTLPAAVDMNRAFTHASDAGDVTVAYYASSQMLVYTVEKFGMPRVVQALKLWGEGVRTPEVIQRAFGVPAAEYDRGFRAWAMARMTRYDKQFIFDERARPLEDAKKEVASKPNDAGARAALALAHAKARELDEAKKEVEQALKLDPAHMQAHFLASRMNKEAAVQREHLVAIQKAGGDGYTVRMGLATAARDQKDKAAARDALEAAHRFDPTQVEPLHHLAELAREEKREADEIELLKKVVLLDQHDRKSFRLLMEKLAGQQRWDEARTVGEAAVYVDVLHGPTHVAYARALTAGGDHARAVFELESALATGPAAKDGVEVHRLLAEAYTALKKPAEAKKHAAEAQKAPPPATPAPSE